MKAIKGLKNSNEHQNQNGWKNEENSGSQGYGNPNYQNQGYENQNYQYQGYQNQNYQNQGYQDQSYQNQGYQNQQYQGYQNNQGYGYNGGYQGNGYGPARRLSKSRTNKMVCGVCAGIAEYFNWDPTIVRLIWVAASLFLGAGFLGLIAYFIVAVVMPEG